MFTPKKGDTVFYTVFHVFPDGDTYPVLTGSKASTPFSTRDLGRARGEAKRQMNSRRNYDPQIHGEYQVYEINPFTQSCKPIILTNK